MDLFPNSPESLIPLNPLALLSYVTAWEAPPDFEILSGESRILPQSLGFPNRKPAFSKKTENVSIFLPTVDSVSLFPKIVLLLTDEQTLVELEKHMSFLGKASISLFVFEKKTYTISVVGCNRDELCSYHLS